MLSKQNSLLRLVIFSVLLPAFLICPANAQGTYPMYPNLQDNTLAFSFSANILGQQGHRLVFFDVRNEQNKLWVTDGTTEGTLRISPEDQTELSLVYGKDSTWYFSEKRGTTFSISQLKPGADTLTQLVSGGLAFRSPFYWKDKLVWHRYSAGGGYDRMYLYNPAIDSLITLVDQGYLDIRGIGSSDSLLFYILNTDEGKMLGSSDGTPENTSTFLKLFEPGSSFSQNVRFFHISNQAYFFYNPSANPFTLWTTDGTAEGTLMLGEYDNPSFGWVSNPATVLNDKLLFILRELGAPSGTTHELHVSDGSPDGTLNLNNTGSGYMNPRKLTHFNNQVYFISSPSGGNDLRRTDGTLEGTELVLSGFGHFSSGLVGIISDFGIYDDSLVVQGYNNSYGSELFISDGENVEGTRLLSDVIRGSEDSYPSSPFQLGDKLIFFAEAYNKNKLWIYDREFTKNCDDFSLADSIVLHLTDTTSAGSISITPAGGQQPYTYKLNGGGSTLNSQFNNLLLGSHTIQVTDNLGCTLEFQAEILDSTTSVIDLNVLSYVKVFPNPVAENELITLEWQLQQSVRADKLEVRMYDNYGRIMLRENVPVDDKTNKQRLQYSTDGMPAGNYFLCLYIEGIPVGIRSAIIR